MCSIEITTTTKDPLNAGILFYIQFEKWNEFVKPGYTVLFSYKRYFTSNNTVDYEIIFNI